MSAPPDSPAARLHALLVAFRASGHTQGGVGLRHVWQAVFGLAPDDVDGLFERLVDARALVREVRARVEGRSDGAVALHLKHYPRIEALVAPTNLDADWRAVAGGVDDLALDSLAFTADWLGRVAAEPAVPAPPRRAGAADLDVAREQVRGAPIDPEVRRCLLSALDAVQYALARYRTAGIAAFRAAWVQVLGTLGADGPDVARAADEVLRRPEAAEARSVFERVARWAGWARRAAETAPPGLEAGKTLGEIAGMLGAG